MKSECVVVLLNPNAVKKKVEKSDGEIKDPKKVTLKNGKPATQGVCPKCGTKVFRIGK